MRFSPPGIHPTLLALALVLAGCSGWAFPFGSGTETRTWEIAPAAVWLPKKVHVGQPVTLYVDITFGDCQRGEHDTTNLDVDGDARKVTLHVVRTETYIVNGACPADFGKRRKTISFTPDKLGVYEILGTGIAVPLQIEAVPDSEPLDEWFPPDAPAPPPATSSYTVRTLAGGGAVGFNGGGFVDGPGEAARFRGPHGIAFDHEGNLIVADTDNHAIRKVTPDGIVTTLAGRGKPGYVDGRGAEAWFDMPYGVAVDSNDNVLVVDTRNHRIRKVAPDGTVTTVAGSGPIGDLGGPNGMGGGFADGPTNVARFSYPIGIAVDSDDTVYVADNLNHRIRKISNGQVSTFVGEEAIFVNQLDPTMPRQFFTTTAVALGANHCLYVPDTAHHCVLKVTPDGSASVYAGTLQPGWVNGRAEIAEFFDPHALTVGLDGSLFVVDACRIRRVRADRSIETLAGAEAGLVDGNGTLARLAPSDIVADAHGRIYVSDSGSHRIRVLEAQ